MIGGAWNTTHFITTALDATFRSKMTPDRMGQDNGFRVFRSCVEPTKGVGEHDQRG